MTATAKTATENQKKEIALTSQNGTPPQLSQGDYRLIPWKDLVPSSTNPRRRINKESVESLAASIRLQGVLEPLIVRKHDQKYEIVCGERRYRAAEVAEVRDLPCLVRELSDEQVLDIQIHENLHREDIHPMDEAYGYQFLKEKLGCDIKELALRVGKSEGYVLNRLKLNQLIKEAQEDIDDNHLPLAYALEIAKYPGDIQKIIYAEVYRKRGEYKGNEYLQVPVKGETLPWNSFIEWINTNIHRMLSKAPFDPKAGNLRSDGLACINCPDRTGAAASLFETNQIGKKDACLNPACYLEKMTNHVEVRRHEIAKTAGVDPSTIPIVRSWCYSDGKGFLGTESANVISGTKRDTKAKTCRNVVSGIDIEADNYGQIVQVCLKSTRCKTHWPEYKSSPAKAKTPEAEAAERLSAHRIRREEIWNAKVAEAVRERVFKQAAENFETKFQITEVGSDFLPQLIAKFWQMTSSGDSNNLHGAIKRLVGKWTEEPGNSNGSYIGTGRSALEYFKKLERGQMFRILFLLIHSHKGTIGHSNNYVSQKEVRALAEEFEVDYPLIDAEVRLEFCPKKHNQVHKDYLESVQAKSNVATVPRLFSGEWKAMD